MCEKVSLPFSYTPPSLFESDLPCPPKVLKFATTPVSIKLLRQVVARRSIEIASYIPKRGRHAKIMPRTLTFTQNATGNAPLFQDGKPEISLMKNGARGRKASPKSIQNSGRKFPLPSKFRMLVSFIASCNALCGKYLRTTKARAAVLLPSLQLHIRPYSLRHLQYSINTGSRMVGRWS